MAAGKVTVYPGKEREGTARVAGSFKDNIFVGKAEIEHGQIILTDPLNRELWRSEVVPELQDYSCQTLTCARSSQSGTLIVTLGGFYAGSRGQRALVLSTDYKIRQEVTYEEYQRGVR